MKIKLKDKLNKQRLLGVVAGFLLIVLMTMSTGVTADTASLPTRGNPAMVYDSESDKIVIFGGWNTSSTPSPDPRDTWIYNFNTDTYTKRTPSPAPRRRAESGIVYDSSRDMIVMFGGLENFSAPGLRDDTWSYDYNANAWAQLYPVTSPSARRAHRMVYDSESDRIILFGGMNHETLSTAIYFNETWVGIPGSNTWQLMSPSIAPPARIGHYMVYDSESDRVILFGGYPGVGTQSLFETWAYDYNSNTWENLTNDNNHPSARSFHIMAYDSESDRVVLFGGGSHYSTNQHTWIYNYNNNSWVQMNPAMKPSARCRHEAVYDSESDRVIIYGGTTGPWTNGNFFIDPSKTWAYDVNSDTWEEVDMGETPPPFIPGYQIVILIGILSIITIILGRKIKKS